MLLVNLYFHYLIMVEAPEKKIISKKSFKADFVKILSWNYFP